MNETKRSTAMGFLGFILGAVLVLVTSSCSGPGGEVTQPQGEYPMDSGCYGGAR
jgi:hypothetical protein